eukprot:CAMPEP_0194396516 /NCGR_PEP_ID=MMETSP0174-20130528/125035_1 /TAXON_ID=216777 /ORGANISM="Proboscia alata, Strain PI-D3" /LENGTH=597 /DNA_ID=CAMNT_0039192597 /DNA_START=84 /DNA_END=1874 /DNA_ORIENTATION=+
MFDYLAAMRMLSSKTVRFFVECVQAFFGCRRKKEHNANRRLDSLDEEDAEEITTSGTDSMVAKSTPLSIATEGNATENEELVSTSQHEKNSKEMVNNKSGNRNSSGNNSRVSFAPSVSESMQNSDQIPNTNKSIVIPRQTTFLPQHTTSEGDSVKSEECQNFFDAAGTDFTMKQLQRDNPVPDKNGYILHTLGKDLSPLLVFVNSRSGLQQGHLIIAQLRRLLNPIQIFDLAEENPEKALESFSILSKLRVLVCGGDGTVNWIISIMEKMNLEWWPPIAILPLGTGNDLSRIHDWGGGYNNKSLMLILQQVSEAYVSLLDRWAVTIEDTKGNIKNKKALTNYLGVGVDAQATLQVHNLRESEPTLFFSRIINKAWYLMFGAEDVFKASCADLPQQVTLVADGVNIPIPADSQGIVFLNIDSYGGGIPLWETGVKINRLSRRRSRYSESDFLSGDFFKMRRNSLDSGRHSGERRDSIDDFEHEYNNTFLSEKQKRERVTSCDRPSSCQDGMLDVVSLRGSFHFGQIRVGLGTGDRLCQCKEATISLHKKLPVQIDGEPWRQHAGTLKVTRKKESAVMLHRSADDGGGVVAEMAKLLDW